MPIEYQRDIPANHGGAMEAEQEHVRDHIASIADPDDDPSTYRDRVSVWWARHPEDPSLIRIEGFLDAEPDAPYLKPDHEPLVGVDPDLFAAEVAAALRDEEVLRGQA